MSTSESGYLLDLGKELLILAETTLSETAGTEFERGRRAAFYEFINLMQQQAVCFGLTYEAVGLGGIKAETFLR